MSRSRRDGVFRTIVERRKIFGRLVAQIIATDSPPRVIVSQVSSSLARALYESRSALLELVGVRLCLSFARVFVLGSKSKRSLLIVSLFLSLVDDDERDLSNYMLTFLYLLNFPTHQPLLLRRDEFGVGLWVPSTLKPT